jgi:hypothetical protein
MPTPATSFGTRPITTKTNTITGASLPSNKVTLPAGTYMINTRAPAQAVDRVSTRLYNATDSAALAYGTSVYAASAQGVNTISMLTAYITLTGTKDLRLDMYCQTTKATDGMGVASSAGGTEVYSLMEITRLH